MVGAVAGLAACTAKKQDAPQLSGPSELATAITMYASPDTLRQDGASQAQITVQARDTKGEAIKNLPIRLDVAVGGVLADYGQLSSKNVYTGSDGRATATYTSPNAPVTAEDANQIVQILATPVGADYVGAVTHSVQIRLVPPGVIIPPSDFPKVLFSFSPSAPLTGTDVTFDGSASVSPTGRIVAYAWDFGDGSTGSGPTVTHRFGLGGSYIVKLTVADDRNLSASDTKTVVVTDSGAPTAAFVFSPTSPVVNQDIFFNASSSTAAPGRTLVAYNWNFGTDRTGTGVTTTKTYGTAGTYNVTLVVTDDIGKKGTVIKAVPVSSGSVTASFTYSPTAPIGNQLINFNASGSISLNPVIAYEWDFGDGATATGVTAQHAYATFASDRSYVVRLTVRDNAGQFATTTQTVTVKAGAGLSPSFTYSPTNPDAGQLVYFNATASTGSFPITDYIWNFGDGTTGSGVTPSHAWSGASCTGVASDKTFVVNLTIKDSTGQTATTSQSVTVKKCGS